MASTAQRVELSERETANLRGVNILLMHHDASYCEYLTTLLEQQQAFVVATDSISFAQVMLETMQVDVLIQDLDREWQEHLDFIQWLHDQQENRHKLEGVTSIALSWPKAEHDLEKLKKAGFMQYLLKPCSPGELTAAVLTLLPHEG